MSPDVNPGSRLQHQQHVENHLTVLSDNFSCKPEDSPIETLERQINDNTEKNMTAGFGIARHLDNDMFDPQGKVRWGDSHNTGFLTQPEAPESGLMKVVQQQAVQMHKQDKHFIQQAFDLSDKHD